MREDYQRARPFPHVVIDDLLPEAVLDAVVDEFPEPNGQWRQFDGPRQERFGGGVTELDLDPTTRDVLADCPAGRARRSLASYYYSSGRPDTEQSDPHRTLFQRRPEEGAVAPSLAATS